MLRCVACVVVMSVAVPVAADDAATPDAKTILQKCAKALSFTDRYSWKVTTTVTTIGEKPSAGLSVQSSTFDIRRYDDDFNINGEMVATNAGSPITLRHHTVFRDGRLVMISSVEQQPRPSVITAKDSANKLLHQSLEMPDRGLALDGFSFGTNHQRLPDLMLSGDVYENVPKEIIAGRDCFKVTSTTEFGKISLWVAGDTYSVLQFNFAKGSSDVFDVTGDKPQTLAELPLHKKSNDDPGKKSVRWTAKLHEVQTTTIGEHEIASAGKLSNTWGYDGSEYTEVYDIQRSEIRLTPPGPETFAIDLPNGTRVTDYDNLDSQKQYEWQNGKVVAAAPVINPYSVIGWQEPPPPQEESKNTFILVNMIVLGVLAVGYLVYWLKTR
ncbi:MAG: hypothetical protein WEB58_02240 [Planctomycetaceae bacterium]